MDLADLYQIRRQLEEGIRQLFTDEEFTAVTRANFPQEFQQKTPRLEIKCTIGAATGHRFPCPDGFARYDRWRCVIALQAVTKPANDGTSALQEIFLGRIRRIAATLAQTTWTDTDHFPAIRLAEPLRDAGDNNTLKADQGFEYSMLSFAATVCIRENAWPVADIEPVPPASGQLATEDGIVLITEDGQQLVTENP